MTSFNLIGLEFKQGLLALFKVQSKLSLADCHLTSLQFWFNLSKQKISTKFNLLSVLVHSSIHQQSLPIWQVTSNPFQKDPSIHEQMISPTIHLSLSPSLQSSGKSKFCAHQTILRATFGGC